MPVHYTPASVRSFKARLRPFTQPKVLGGLTGLSLIAFGIWMYANRVDPTLFSLETLQKLNPQSWFTQPNNLTADELPTDPADASATAADIESSDVLKQLLSGQTPPVNAPKSTKDGQKPAGISGVDKDQLSAESILQRLSGATTGTTPGTTPGTTTGTTPGTTALSTLGNPTLTPSATGLSAPLVGSQTGSIAQSIILGTGYGSPNTPASNTTAPPTNALQAAFDHNNARTATTPQNTPATETAPSLSSSSSFSPILSPGEPLPPPPGLSPSSLSSSQPLPVLPLTSTTGTSTPSTYSNSPTSPSPYSTNVVPANPKPVTASPLPSPLPALPPSATSNYDYNYGSVPAPLPTTPYTYTAPSPSYPTATPQSTVQPLPTQPAVPYSVDSPIPGRVLGGGEINTFGNP